jgi:hypothetical protein
MAEEGEKGEGKGFKVADRRRFSPDTGEPREANEEGSSPEPRRGSEQAESGPPGDREALPPIAFSTFLISLSTQALLHLGEISDPLTGKLEKDVELAKQMIDIIGVLKEKTRGNLDDEETKLVDDILFSLHMKYVEAVKKT